MFVRSHGGKDVERGRRLPAKGTHAMTDIKDIGGIGPTHEEKLRAVGIGTAAALLDAADSRKGREDLAAATGISEQLLLEWVARGDLTRVEGVSSEYAVLLEAAGVNGAPELAIRDAANLMLELEQINEAEHLVRRTPSLSEVEGWIAHAATLPEVVTH